MFEQKSKVYPVSELNRIVKSLLESELPLLWVAGEISNLTKASSGHWYFSLKDKQAQVRCIMFRFRNQLLNCEVNNGLQVELLVSASLYEARGDFQLTVEQLRPAGVGSLYEQFARLKQQLELEGLFARERKRPLPRFPQIIGIVSSPQAAALRDALTTLQKRMPSVKVILYPSLVQGKDSEYQIAHAIELANRRAECELLLLCRGGGSIEDLWAFNEPVVAYAIANSKIPIISGIGHETDFTIADFVADQRAATPTAAAQLAVPDRNELLQQLSQKQRQLQRLWQQQLQNRMQQLDFLQRRLIHPQQALGQQQQKLQSLRKSLQQSWLRHEQQQHWQQQHLQQRLSQFGSNLLLQQQHKLEALQQGLSRNWTQHRRQQLNQLDQLQQQLQLLNPQQVLARGYSLVHDQRGQLVRDSKQLKTGEHLQLRFAAGSATAVVKTLADQASSTDKGIDPKKV